jgi:hypothetical protein
MVWFNSCLLSCNSYFLIGPKDRNIFHLRLFSSDPSSLSFSAARPPMGSRALKGPAGSLFNVDKEDWLYFKIPVGVFKI